MKTDPEQLRAQLAALFERGSLASSAVSRALRAELRPLVDSGVVSEVRAGAGRRWQIRDPEALRAFIAHRFPEIPVAGGASSREVGVARFRDSKALPSDLSSIVCARCWRPAGLRRDGVPVGADAATAAHGVFAFLLGDTSTYTLQGPWALVENAAVFIHFERLRLEVKQVIYGRGRISARLLDWLAGTADPEFSLLHLPDYDPVGLSEFARLRARLGRRVRLHLPQDLEDQFARLSNPALLDPALTRGSLARLRTSTVPEIRRVVALIDRHNAGLEQEALLLG